MRLRSVILVTVGPLFACSSGSTHSPTEEPHDAGMVMIILPPPDAGAKEHDASHHDARADVAVDAGWDAAICNSSDASTSLPCGTLEFTKSAIAARPRNHHVTLLVPTSTGDTMLYAIGGFGGTEGSITYNNVDRSPIAKDGSLGAWVSEPALPVAAGGGVGEVVSGVVVFAGGLTSTNVVTNAAYSAVVQPDGSLGAWNTAGTIVNGRMHAGTVTQGNTMWILGGFSGQSVWSDIVSATVAADGTVSTWANAGQLPGPRSHFSLTRVDNYVYVTGGLAASAFDNPPDLTDTLRGEIEANGTIDNWVSQSTLPEGEATHAAFFYGGYLHICGGINNVPAQEDRCWRAPIGSDHTLGAFEQIASLPIARGHVHQMPVLGQSVYSIAGAIDFSLTSTTEIDIGVFGSAKAGSKAPPRPEHASAPKDPNAPHGFVCHMAHKGGAMDMTP